MANTDAHASQADERFRHARVEVYHLVNSTEACRELWERLGLPLGADHSTRYADDVTMCSP